MLIRIQADDTIVTQGIDWGKWNIKIELLDFKLPYIFIRIEGRTAYCDRMSGSSYSSPSYNIWKIIKEDERSWKLAQEWTLFSFEYEYNRKNKKEKYQEAFKKFKELTENAV